MAAKRLEDMSEVELEKARRYLDELSADVARNVRATPFAEWSPVTDGIEKARHAYVVERARRDAAAS